MSYASASAQTSITVQRGQLTLTVTPSPPWTPGQTLTFTVALPTPVWTTDTVYIYANNTQVTSFQITSGVGGSGTWVIPQSYAGQTVTFMAQDTLLMATSNTVSGTVLYPTKITISAPSTVYPNQPFTVSGVLQYQDAYGNWNPLAGATVTVKGSWGGSATATTNSSGQYSVQLTAPSSPGTYTVTASFAGSSSAAAAMGYSPLAVSPPPGAPPVVTLPEWAWGLVGLAVGLIAGGLIGYAVGKS
jgi:hypothetical protein